MQGSLINSRLVISLSSALSLLLIITISSQLVQMVHAQELSLYFSSSFVEIELTYSAVYI